MEYLEENLIGVIIVIASIVLTTASLIFARLRWGAKNKVTDWYRGVGIIYREGAVKPWPGLEETIDSILDQQAHEQGDLKTLKGWKDFWIEVVAYENVIKTKGIPDGYIWDSGPRKGYSCPPPRTDEEAFERAIVNGTRRVTSWIFFSRKYFVMMVRQIRGQKDKIAARMRREEDAMRDAGWSAIHHEHAEHHVSVLLYDDSNVYHKRQDLKDLKLRMRTRYNEYRQEKKT